MRSYYRSEEGGATDLRAFCEDRYPKLVGTLSLYCGDRDVAEELAQEALVRCCRDWKKVRVMESPEAWLHRVALNLARSKFRRRAAEKRATARLDPPRETVPDTGPDRIALRDAVAALPHRQKVAVILRYYLDLSIEETSFLMDCPEGTVKTLTHKGLATLRFLPEVGDLKGATDAV